LARQAVVDEMIRCPLLGVKRTFPELTSMSAFDPKSDMGSQSSRLNLVYFDVSDLTLGVGEAEATKNSPY
jgi:hypothetical protein